ADAGNYTVNTTALTLADMTPASLGVVAHPQSKIFGASDPPLTFSVAGLISNPALGIDETENLVLSGTLNRVPGESALDGPYAIGQGTLTSNENYLIDFIGSFLVIIGAADEPVLGFNVGQFIFAGVINNIFYYQPGNFWHISLNPNNADPGFDVMRGTEEFRSRVNRCDSVSGAGYCETWSFPQQFGDDEDVE
ncbi:MAG: MBG domain-containing protein, partial [Pseudomonadales bacterium]